MRCKACLNECMHSNRNFFRYSISSLNKHFILSRHFFIFWTRYSPVLYSSTLIFIMQPLRKRLLTDITQITLRQYYEREI